MYINWFTFQGAYYSNTEIHFMLISETQYVCDGLLYMYVCTCIAVPVGFVHAFLLFTESVSVRASESESKEK